MSGKPSFPAKIDTTRRLLAKLPPPLVQRRPVPVVVTTPVVVSVVPVVKALYASPNLNAKLSATAATKQAAPKFSPDDASLDTSSFRNRMVMKLKNQGIEDPRVIQAMQTVQRHRFVDSALGNQAYEDTSLPIGWGQTISKPNVVARMIELLFQGKAGPLGRVLEIGTGCGYQAAVLSLIAQEVYSIERVAGLYHKARENFRPFRIKNTHLLFGDGMLGFPKGAPYTGIIAAAGGDAIPQAWIDQLAVGGRIVAPVTNSSNNSASGASEQSLVVIDKSVTGLKRTVLELVQFVPLKSGLA